MGGALLTGGLSDSPPAWGANYDVTDSASFVTAIQNAANGDTININSSFTMASAVDVLNADVTIIGNGNTIDAADTYRPFFIEGGTVTISDLSIHNGVARGGDGGGGGLGAGGAIFVDSGANVQLDDVNFVSNDATGGNGSASSRLGGGGLSGHDSDGGDGGPSVGPGTAGSNNGGDGGNGDGGSGTNGLFGGGGGGGAESNAGIGGNGGDGGFGGGGGSGGNRITAGSKGGDGGAGGFGGGGGAGGFGSITGIGGAAGFGGGAGASDGGGGGAGFGGAVFVRDGGQLTVTGGSFTGGTANGGTGAGAAGDGSGDGDALFLHNVTATFNIGSGDSMTVADGIGGTASGSLIKNGDGTLTLGCINTYQGSTTINAGRLVVDGSLDSDTNVASGGELGGIGTINGDVVNNGTMAAGNSIGTFTVAGDYTSNVGSTTQVEVQAATNPTTPGVDNDLIDVTGTATINGGIVSVEGAAGSYSIGTQYTFLNAAGGVAGTYDSIIDDLAFINAELGYTANSAFFSLNTNFMDIAATSNQGAVSEYLDSNSPTASGDVLVILNAFLPLTQSEAQAGLSQLGGAVYGTGRQVGIQGTSQMLGTIVRQLRPNLSPGQWPMTGGYASDSPSRLPSTVSDSPLTLVSYQESEAYRGAPTTRCRCNPGNRWGGWVLGYGLGGSAQSDGNAEGIGYGLGGTTFGVERLIDRCTRVGFFGGYLGSRVDVDNMNQRQRVNGGNLGGFFTHTCRKRYAIGMGGFQFDEYDSDRTVQIGGLTRMARGDSNGWQAFTYGEQGLNLRLAQSMLFQPFVGLQYVYARQNGFTETGAGAMNLNVAGSDIHSLRSILGSRLMLQSHAIRGCLRVTPEVSALWMHEFLDTTSIVNASFAGVGGAGYSVNGLNLGRDWAVAGFGLSSRLNHHWSVRADYNSQFNSHQVFHLGSGALSYVW